MPGSRRLMQLVVAGVLVATVFVATAPAVAASVTVDCDAGYSLQDAVDAAAPETVIEVSGECEELIAIDKPLVIRGTATLQAPAALGPDAAVISISSGGVVVEGLRLVGFGQPVWRASGGGPTS